MDLTHSLERSGLKSFPNFPQNALELLVSFRVYHSEESNYLWVILVGTESVTFKKWLCYKKIFKPQSMLSLGLGVTGPRLPSSLAPCQRYCLWHINISFLSLRVFSCAAGVLIPVRATLRMRWGWLVCRSAQDTSKVTTVSTASGL